MKYSFSFTFETFDCMSTHSLSHLQFMKAKNWNKAIIFATRKKMNTKKKKCKRSFRRLNILLNNSTSFELVLEKKQQQQQTEHFIKNEPFSIECTEITEKYKLCRYSEYSFICKRKWWIMDAFIWTTEKLNKLIW